MKVFRYYAKGLSLTGKKVKLVFYQWIIFLLFSLLPAAFFFFSLDKFFSSSLMEKELLKGLHLYWIEDIYHNLSFQLKLAGPIVTVAALIGLALLLFLNGGVVGRLAAEEKITLSSFFADCGKFFWGMVKLFLLSLPFYGILVLLPYSLLAKLFDSLFKQPATAWTPFFISWVRLLLALLLFTAVNLLFDYAKAAMIQEGRGKAIKAFIKALRFMKSNFLAAWGIYLLLWITALAGTFLFLEAGRALNPAASLLIVIAFIYQQLYIFFRFFMRTSYLAAAVKFYSSRT